MLYRVESTLEAYVTSAYLFLEGDTIQLSYDGESTYRSTDFLEIDDGTLDVVLRVYGLNGTGWTFKLAITRPGYDGYKKEYEKQGHIIRNQTDLLKEDVNLATEPEEV